jgi:hypothetical protein
MAGAGDEHEARHYRNLPGSRRLVVGQSIG